VITEDPVFMVTVFHVCDRALAVIESVTSSCIKTTLKSELRMRAPTDGSGRYQAFRRYL
jgi:hypothetical protein